MGVERTGETPRLRSESKTARAARGQARPNETPRAAMFVQPLRLILGHAQGNDVPLPGGGRCLEAFELSQHRRQRVGPLHSRLRQYSLPFEEKPQEVARRHGLDLGAQPLDGVAMDAGQQAALAPFFVGGRCTVRIGD